MLGREFPLARRVPLLLSSAVFNVGRGGGRRYSSAMYTTPRGHCDAQIPQPLQYS
jgi:hypothetical protein